MQGFFICTMFNFISINPGLGGHILGAEQSGGRLLKIIETEETEIAHNFTHYRDLAYDGCQLLLVDEPTKEILTESIEAFNPLVVVAFTTTQVKETFEMFAKQTETEDIFNHFHSLQYVPKYAQISGHFYGMAQDYRLGVYIAANAALSINLTYPPHPPRPINFHHSPQRTISGIVNDPGLVLWPRKEHSTIKAIWGKCKQGKTFEESEYQLYGKKKYKRYFKTHPDITIPHITNQEYFYHWNEFRMFSLKELARLFSFPDGYNVNTTDLLKSIPPAIAKGIITHINETVFKYL